MNIEGLSLDQLRAVLAVVETGSFSGAARRFGRAQSAVSYAIASAEAQLGLALFERGGRRAELTPAGRALISDIRAIVARTDDLKARAEAAARGTETESRLAVDAVWPAAWLSAALAEFAVAYPALPVHIHVDSLGMVVERVVTGAASIGIVATINDLPDGLTRYTLPPVGMTAVAARGHELTHEAGTFHPSECRPAAR